MKEIKALRVSSEAGNGAIRLRGAGRTVEGMPICFRCGKVMHTSYSCCSRSDDIRRGGFKGRGAGEFYSFRCREDGRFGRGGIIGGYKGQIYGYGQRGDTGQQGNRQG
jgi:hypothetical protein